MRWTALWLATVAYGPRRLLKTDNRSERSEIWFGGRGCNYFTAWECDDLLSTSWINQTVGNRGYFEANKALLLFATRSNCTYMKTTIFECSLVPPVNQTQTVTQEQMRVISTKLSQTVGGQGIGKFNFRKRKLHNIKKLVVIPKEEIKRSPIFIHSTDKRGRN